ncbi:GNAT family N-acetyltransferase [Massilia litorea]|jgi:GNAT superfamily N-acetyltransferase|uniref:GNAT family N-acetyltransferase n=1 Tax=Massilia litorea TaxID=2769491 RepID=A0A7L9U2Y1_9BURK|nr:GNAT family N-acetyltransferase [Massilia litorea]QOL49338.1 GNAT family N-acetyltransferase [Massilia litorea]
MKVAVRRFAPADKDPVNAIARAAFAEYAAHYADWPSFIGGIGRMADLAGDGDLFVAERDGVIAGAVVHVGPGRPRSAIFPDDWSVIRMLVVAPDWRGHGIGRLLVAACLEAARDAGAPVVGLHTSPVMASALRMYTAIGFERDSDLPPIRSVPYGRYVLTAERLETALAILRAVA